MPKEKQLTELIPRMYKWNAENLGLFFFVKAQLQTFPTLSIGQAIANFRKFTGITVDQWDDESIRSTYIRLQKEYYDCSKENKGDTGSQTGSH